jgi:CMP/dCMP kinase
MIYFRRTKINWMDKSLIIAIDGHSSCGKSSFAKAIARKLGYIYIDSGAMYRAVTLYCLDNNLIAQNSVDYVALISILPDLEIKINYNTESQRYETWLNGQNVEDAIRRPSVSESVSLIAKIKAVRERLVKIQRSIGANKGIVMDGRDIGTVVFPQADLKIFMTASLEVRAERRYKELIENGVIVKYEDILSNLKNRDETDSTREESPLRQANDAILLDNSHITPEEQMRWFEKLYQKTIQN